LTLDLELISPKDALEMSAAELLYWAKRVEQRIASHGWKRRAFCPFLR
jgi:hypothetical protein